MKLENIGFYTLEDKRARNTSIHSPLWRCELILTEKCNFKCPYCRRVGETISFKNAMKTIKLWASEGLKNIRFSGGEPTLYNRVDELVKCAKKLGINRIALSTNGSVKYEYYKYLYECGVNDFSISLDACCASTGEIMSGIRGNWKRVTENIKRISRLVYTTVGIVINEDNFDQCVGTICFADTLGVSDIRIIPSSQYNKLLTIASQIPRRILKKYPILRYRINNIKMNRNVRGLRFSDSNKCSLVLDDMAVMGNYHFPCIIYLREGGNAIGRIGKDVRNQRKIWYDNHDTFKDEICKRNCLDVCIDYNNRVESLKNS